MCIFLSSSYIVDVISELAEVLTVVLALGRQGGPSDTIVTLDKALDTPKGNTDNTM